MSSFLPSFIKQKIPSNPISYVHKIIYGRNDYSPKVKTILSTVGDDNIVSIKIARHPLPFLLEGALNVLSFGKFKENNPYDKLFHLSMIIQTSNHLVSLEKNEVINMDINPSMKTHTETIDVLLITQNLSINELLKNTQQQMQDKFFPYNAHENNCQTFILNILTANYLDTPENIEFTKQNTEQLFHNLDYLRKIANTVTDVAGRFDVINEGGALSHTPDNGLTNKDIEEIMYHYACSSVTFNGVFSKDKLPKHLKSGWYIINMENEKDGHGSHWTTLKFCNDGDIIYFDSFGIYPPIEVMKKAKNDIIYSSKQIQDINSTACGWFCIGCIMNDNKTTINDKSKFKIYIDMFSNNPTKNDLILKRYINTY
jgi:hypothetical protein